jgi:hypothetical protein
LAAAGLAISRESLAISPGRLAISAERLAISPGWLAISADFLAISPGRLAISADFLAISPAALAISPVLKKAVTKILESPRCSVSRGPRSVRGGRPADKPCILFEIRRGSTPAKSRLALYDYDGRAIERTRCIMTTLSNDTTKAAATATTDNTDPNLATPRAHQAQDLINLIAALEASIPFFTMPPADLKPQPLSVRKAITNGCVVAAALAVDNSTELRATLTFTPNELRDLLDYATSYEGVVARIEALARGARYAIDLKRAQAGEDAMQVYKATQTLTRFGRNPHLAPHLRSMREALGRTGGKRTVKAKTAPQVPTTTPVTTTKPTA